MSESTKDNSNFFKPPKQLFGIKGLANTVDYDVLIYILKSVYRLVLHSSQLKESRIDLKRRIQQFERDSLIPAFLSSLPLDQLIEQLEDAQYYYPITEQSGDAQYYYPIYLKDVVLPKFR